MVDINQLIKQICKKIKREQKEMNMNGFLYFSLLFYSTNLLYLFRELIIENTGLLYHPVMSLFHLLKKDQE